VKTVSGKVVKGIHWPN